MTSNTTYPKRLIEVDLPIKRISAHARREKSIRHGHISTLHIWWARRPLAACRAVICASLWPDPVDVSEQDMLKSRKEGYAVQPNRCPPSFRSSAAKIIKDFATRITTDNCLATDHCSPENFKRWAEVVQRGFTLDSREGQLQLRTALLDFIADFANWDNSTESVYLETSRALTQSAHESLGGVPGTKPLVVDPFAGGGSIPLEALRVGADAFASDLNPLPVLLNKVVLEYIPKYGQRLADEVRNWGEWIKNEAEKELSQFYPKRFIAPKELRQKPLLLIDARGSHFSCVTTMDIQEQLDESAQPYTHYVEITPRQVHEKTAMQVALGGTHKKSVDKLKQLGAKTLNLVEEIPIAYLWARTIKCEGPGCGAEVPLIRSLWLAKQSKRSVALQLLPKPETMCVNFQIIVRQNNGWINQDDPSENIADPQFDGPAKRGSATCPCCGFTTPVARVREQLKSRHGGANDARLTTVVVKREGEQGRTYRLPMKADFRAIEKATIELRRMEKAHADALSLVPNETLPLMSGVFNVPIYGMVTWGDLFSHRQLLALTTLVKLAQKATTHFACSGDQQFPRAVQTVIGLAISRFTDICNALCMWETTKTQVRHVFTRQALGMLWDFAEPQIFADAAGNFNVTLDTMLEVIEKLVDVCPAGTIEQASATAHPLPEDAADALITDPPYYNAVPYADLSDFFYVWLRRILQQTHPNLFLNPLAPKTEEVCEMSGWDPDRYSNKDAKWFEQQMGKAMSEGRRVLKPSGVGIVVFAHKSTAGWEAQLQAMINAGWIITGSWPIDTELGNRLRAQGSAALASSVHLVCRPRENQNGSVRNDEVGDWRDVLAELPRRIHAWMPRLAEEGVVGADAIFACLGPALEVFSRYSSVEKASGDKVELPEYLAEVWSAVSREAINMIFSGADASGFEEDARLTAMWLWTLATGEQPVGAEESDDEETDDEDVGKKQKPSGGFRLEYDAARKIAQGLGAHLEKLTSLVAVQGESAILLPVSARASFLFGSSSLSEQSAQTKRKKNAQLDLFDKLDLPSDEDLQTRKVEVDSLSHANTTLDRVHQAMLLFAAGRSEAMKRFLVEDGAGRNPHFWCLAQALSALYPSSTDEKRWVDGILARKKGLGF